VSGRNALTWEEKFAYDLRYVDRLSLRLDVAILWATCRQVLKRQGIHQPGQATMERFQGN
jgi:lipopolysaccharide/colanic/teichoic acid biosynthesis glycosyltransferase